MKINKEKTVAFIGSHTAGILSGKNDNNLLNVLQTEIYLLVASFCKQGFRTFLSGMSDGFEKIAAGAVQSFQKEKEDIGLIIVQPNAEMQWDDYLLANSSQLVCYCDNQDNDTMQIYEIAKTKGMPTTNLHTLLTDYFANNSPASQALQLCSSTGCCMNCFFI